MKSGASNPPPLLASLTLFAVALIIRAFRFANPPFALKDESYWLQVISNYKTGNFFLAKHPPLTGLLLYACSRLVSIGKVPVYGEILDLKILHLRLVSALISSALPVLAYLTLRRSNHTTALMCSALLLVDNGLVSEGRTIGASLVSTLLAAFFFTHSVQKDLLCGVCVGLLITCDVNAGLTAFVFALIHSLALLWDDFVALVPMKIIGKRIIKMTLSLSLSPLITTFAVCAMHLSLLSQVIDPSVLAQIHPGVLQSISPVPPTHRQILYGSRLTIRHTRSPSLYLHSHPYAWPEGSRQQQVTGYAFTDPNNIWEVTPAEGSERVKGEPLRSGDRIRFRHVVTGRFLHSHNHPAPESDPDHNKEVTCYGNDQFSDSNDDWLIKRVDELGNELESEQGSPIDAIHHHFKLIHTLQGCHLNSFAKKLPDYAFGQFEVTCGRETLRRNATWHADFNNNKASDLVSYKPDSLTSRVWTAYKESMRTEETSSFLTQKLWSGRLVEDPVRQKLAQSNPKVYSDFYYANVYEFPNPIIVMCAAGAILVFLGGCIGGKLVNLFGGERGKFFRLTSPAGTHFFFSALYFIVGTIRPASLKPAYLSSVFLYSHLQNNRKLAILLFVLAVSAFLVYSPLTYGISLDPRICERLQRGPFWNFECAQI